MKFSLLFFVVSAVMSDGTPTAPESAGDSSKHNIDDTDVSSTVLAYYCESPKSCSPIFEHSKNPTWTGERKRYYVFPQFQVDVSTVSFKSVEIFNQHYVQFEIQMFDQCYLQKVAAYLTTVVKAPVNAFQVAPYGLHQLRLTWSTEPQSGTGINMPPNPIPQTTQTPRVELKVIAETGEKAEQLATSLQSQPELFDFFRLDYSLTGAQTSEHLVTVKSESATTTDFYSKLKNTMGNPKTAYLTSDDVNNFAQQTLQNVIVAEYQDSSFVPTQDNRVAIQDLIKQALIAGQETISSADDHRWSSVFWNEEWSRPDYLTHFLSDKFKQDQGSSRNFSFYNEDLKNYLEKHSISSGSSGGGASISIGSFGFGGHASHSSSSSGSSKADNRTKMTISEDNMRDWLLQNHDNIEWTGKKFQVKPMQLSRVNVQKLSSGTTLTVTSIQSQKVNVDGKAQLMLLNTTKQGCEKFAEAWDQRLDAFEANLKAQATKEAADKTALDSQIKAAVKVETDRSTKALAAANTPLSTSIGDVKTQFTTLSGQVTQIQGKVNALNWVQANHYCIWKSGACPPGFKAVSVYQNSIDTTDNCDGGQVCGSRGAWGDSKITGPDNFPNIVIAVCCK